jgi:hypothetical protein
MSTVREAQAEFTSIASNVDSVWVRWFGYSRTAENTVHVIDNDIKHLTFDLGHHSTYQPDKVLGTIMYQTLDDAWLPMHSDACYVVFSTDIPCKVRLLKYVDGKCTLFRFDDTTMRFVETDEDLREWRIIRHWYKFTHCPTAEKDSRFKLLNCHGLQYYNTFVKSLPGWLLEDKEITAVNYVTRRTADNTLRMNHWAKFSIIGPISFQAYRFMYFDAYSGKRDALIHFLDPKKVHLGQIPRGILFNAAFALWVTLTIRNL